MSDLDDLLLLLLMMNADDDYPDVHSACSYWTLTPFPILLLLSDRYHWSNDVDDDFHCLNVFLQLVDVLMALFRRVSNVFSVELEQIVTIHKENYCIDFGYNFAFRKKTTKHNDVEEEEKRIDLLLRMFVIVTR